MINDESKCRIEKRVAVLSTNERGFTKEVNCVSWYGNSAKLDIREWKPDGTSRKGVTLTDEDGIALLKALTEFYKNKYEIRKDK